jgi:DNA-3-methyladenine glycosylase
MLNLVLISKVDGELVSGRLVEVEAYDEHDPASHSYRGPTERNRTMFGPPGHLYVYLSYGLHLPMNVVTGPEGSGAAVLIRAVDLLEGHDVARRRRGGRRDRELTNGPGKVAQALGIERGHDGLDLLDPSSPVRLVDDGTPPPPDPLVGPRIGISQGVDTPWRFRVP